MADAGIADVEFNFHRMLQLLLSYRRLTHLANQLKDLGFGGEIHFPVHCPNALAVADIKLVHKAGGKPLTTLNGHSLRHGNDSANAANMRKAGNGCNQFHSLAGFHRLGAGSEFHAAGTCKYRCQCRCCYQQDTRQNQK